MSVSEYSFEQLDGGLAAGHADDLLAAAWAEAESVRAAARAEGFQAGLEEGRRSFEASSAPALAALGAAASGLDAVADELGRQLESQAAEVALTLAEHVIGAAVAVSPELVVNICRGALRRLAERTRVTALVHPDDLELLLSHVEALIAQLGGIERIDVQADRRVARGGCVVRTAEGEIDATIGTQLARARDIVIDALREEPSGDLDA